MGNETILLGACRFCGQVLNTPEAMDREEADRTATERCSCRDAQRERERRADAERETARREETLRRARENCELILRAGAGKMGVESMDDALVNMAQEAAALVYDGVLRTITLQAEGGTRVKLSMTSKDKLVVERSDVETNRLEA